MGLRGPKPKDPEKRARRNASLPMTELERGAQAPEAPPLPGRTRFTAATREWYRTWAESEQAVEFLGTDWQRLHMLAPLVDRYHRSVRAGNVAEALKLMAEIRMSEKQLGATPDDRQRLRWKLRDASAGPGPRPAPSRGRPDPRRLSVVS